MADHRDSSDFAVDRNPTSALDGSKEIEGYPVAIRHPTDPAPAPRTAAMTSGSTAATATALTATLGLAAASWAVAVRQMNGMDMGVATELGSFGFFAAVWVSMMAAMMLPGAAPAVVRHARIGRMRAVPLFVGTYLAVWALAGFAVYAMYRPHGSAAAGAVVIAAGVYEVTPLKRHFRRRCRDSVRSGLEFGLCCVGSSIGLMLMLVALGVMSVTWMAVIAVLAFAQKLLPPKAALDMPLALAIVGLGVLIIIAPSSVPGLHPTDVTTRRRQPMTDHKTGTREEWLAARLELLEAEKAVTRRSDELARQRQELPWVRIDKEYVFDTDQGPASLTDLFSGRSQLLVYHFMFGPEYTAGCPACSAIADGFNGFVAHLANHDVMLWAVSRAPLAKLQAYRQRMGWSFLWASSFGGDFNHHFQVGYSEEQQQSGVGEYNFRAFDLRASAEAGDQRPLAAWAATTGTDWATYTQEAPGMSAFVLDDGDVYHTYSAYARGLDGLWGMYQWLDRAPRGRNEARTPDAPLNWFRRHDEYDSE